MIHSVPLDISNRPAASRPHDMPQSPETDVAGKPTYSEILKSSAYIGASSLLCIAVGIVRTKVMAVLLGPAGFGLFGLYGSILDLAQSVAGMGVKSSGVRQIAEAAASSDNEKIARTVKVVRVTSILLGLVGGTLLFTFAKQVSVFTFGTDDHSVAVALLGVALFLILVAGGQAAVIQGMRRIFDLAKMGVVGALLGTVATITLLYFLGKDGVVPSLIAVAAMSIATSWWYSRKISIKQTAMTAAQFKNEAGVLLKLGFAFMASGFLMMGAAYVVRIIVLRHAGLDAAGHYQTAWTLGGVYVAFVLQSMGADFYPRLVGVAKINSDCNRLVNEQAQVSLLLAGPGVLATLAFASPVITLFYSDQFVAATDVLRWICLGMALRVVTWPMGFIIVAKGNQPAFLGTELAWTVVYVGLAVLFVEWLGLAGAGIAFFASYIFHGVMVYAIVRVTSGFRWSASNRKTAVLFFLLIAGSFYCFYVLPPWIAMAFGVVTTVLGGVFSIWMLTRLVEFDRIPRPIQRVLVRLRLVRS
jgi:antigen flippase